MDKNKLENQPTEGNTALEVVMLAGKILMECGAEIYRIETTMSHMADYLGIIDFKAYVVNRGIFVSAMTKQGISEARVVTTQEIQMNLQKLEAVNALSRQLSSQKEMNIAEIYKKLALIDNTAPIPLVVNLVAYFLGASGFSMALGASVGDSLIAGFVGLILGIVFRFIGSKIQTGFLLAIIGSSVVTFVTNVFYMIGLGEQRSFIILGTLMILIPGAFFVNAIREFSQNNASTGISLMMTSLVICSSISVGVAMTIGVLPFAEQLSGTFSVARLDSLSLILRTITAGIGTVAFAILYHVPERYYRDLGILGSGSWLIYLLLLELTNIEPLAVFVSAIFVAFWSRVLSINRRCPVSIFLSTSMFPLIPGLGIYRAVYFLLIGNNQLASHHMRSAFLAALMIAIAISIVQQLPLGRVKK